MIHAKVLPYVSYGSVLYQYAGVFDGGWPDLTGFPTSEPTRCPLPVPITVTGLMLYCADAAHPGATLRCVKNGVDTTDEVTLPPGQTTPVYVDDLARAYAAGDDICYKVLYN